MKKLLLLCLLLPLLSSCSKEEDYVYPNVLTEMIDLQTDETGTAAWLITDKGIQWHIQPRQGLDALVPDTTYRTVTMYEPLSPTDDTVQEAILYNTQLVIAPIPQPVAEVKEVKTDPVTLQSIWHSGNYLNLIVQIKAKDKKHVCKFIENELTTDTSGKQTLHLTLYHDRNNDVEGFDVTAHLSVPLWAYADVLNKGDRIVFHLNTYKEGMTSHTFEY